MKRIIAGIAPASALVFGMTACGGDGSQSFDDAAAVADAFGCNDFKPASGGPDIYADSTGDCESEGVEISTFPTSEAKDTYVDQAIEMGGEGEYLVGENWTVWNTGNADLDAIQADLGGDIH